MVFILISVTVRVWRTGSFIHKVDINLPAIPSVGSEIYMVTYTDTKVRVVGHFYTANSETVILETEEV